MRYILISLIAVLFAVVTQAQTFKKVKVAQNAPIAQVVAGGASVWALGSNGHPYVFNGKSFVLANSISLSQLAVGGGNSAQADAVWALNSSGNIYRGSKSGTSWTFSQVSGVLALIAVGPGYQESCHPYEVWGLNSSSQIFRYNFCNNNWDQEPGTLCDVHVGGGDIWGADCGPDVFRFNFSSGNFDQIRDPFGGFPALAVGPNGGVWAIDTANDSIFQYDPSSGFQMISLCCFAQLQAGGNGVWALGGNSIVRLEPSTMTLVPVPGSLDSLSVGSGGGVWGVNSSNQVFEFSTP